MYDLTIYDVRFAMRRTFAAKSYIVNKVTSIVHRKSSNSK